MMGLFAQCITKSEISFVCSHSWKRREKRTRTKTILKLCNLEKNKRRALFSHQLITCGIGPISIPISSSCVLTIKDNCVLRLRDKIIMITTSNCLMSRFIQTSSFNHTLNPHLSPCKYYI